MSEFTVKGIIAQSEKTTASNGVNYVKLKVFNGDNTKTVNFNIFENAKVLTEAGKNLDIFKAEESFIFTLDDDGKYINFKDFEELADSEKIEFTPEQRDELMVIHYEDDKPKTNTVFKGVSKPFANSSKTKSYFTELSQIVCKTAKKGKFTYISWVEAWTKLKEVYPNATSKVYENNDGLPIFNILKGAFVKVGVTVNGIEHICWHPVLNNQNNEVTSDKITTFQLNTSLQRALTKAIAFHGLGLYVFHGEDLPNFDEIEEL